MSYIGVDLHKNNFQVCYINGQQKKFSHYSIHDLEKFKETLNKEDHLAVESTGNTRYFMNQVKEAVGRVVVVNPRQFKVISNSVKKTDKQDAEQLALFLSKDMLPEVRMKDEKRSQLKSLANTRDKLVKLRTALKNKVHNILNAHGIVTPREAFSSNKSLDGLKDYAVNELAHLEIEVIVSQIRSLNEGIKRLDKQIEDAGKDLDGFENITSIKGIGKKSGTILLSIIGDINDFADPGKLASFFGVVPRISNSNENIHQGRITKQGSKLGRTTLVQCTLIAIRYSDYLRSFYERLKLKKGSGKAIIATARKFLDIIYMTLKNKLIFEDFPNFVLKSS
ncbi:MAG: IS110 family transposase [Calditrichaceae bacterium]|nr:IS110 family transposase [Calditrichaceae bacterium]MBN2709779.1 IS110 family transposase [Calditrichaceae bacterium]RQV94973.1 MAG: IS110 family transposase [Calditrichota bacterium]